MPRVGIIGYDHLCCQLVWCLPYSQYYGVFAFRTAVLKNALNRGAQVIIVGNIKRRGQYGKPPWWFISTVACKKQVSTGILTRGYGVAVPYTRWRFTAQSQLHR